MSDLDATTPRVFIARHGETEWTKNGRYTGLTDLELTPAGVQQVTGTARQLVGSGKLVDPARIEKVWVSPRKRAQQTFHILFGATGSDDGIDAAKVELTEDIAEWNYGEYDGLITKEIRALRKERGLDTTKEWDIWRDGCEGGESAEMVTERLDRLIQQIRSIQKPCMDGSKPADVVLVAHGHILRAFVKRWLNYPLETPLSMMISPGAVGILSYKNRDINEPAFFIGMSIP
ncbi:histidine phosphatase superfamily [Aspergillus karnatakaensis]|uniref:histidine phosphatase family protein n=1 Tax=Aspergillus karnatakaensis TaxID=1810916 RepID=UPI003CCD6F08